MAILGFVTFVEKDSCLRELIKLVALVNAPKFKTIKIEQNAEVYNYKKLL